MITKTTFTTIAIVTVLTGCGGGSSPTSSGGVQERLQAVDEGYRVRCAPAGNGEEPAVTCVVTRREPIPLRADEAETIYTNDALRFAEREYARSAPGAGRIEFVYRDEDGTPTKLECNRSWSDGTSEDGDGSDCGG